MADPLSIVTGVVGLGTALCQISKVLTRLAKNSKDAASQATVALVEVNETSVVLTQLQSYLLGLESADKSRTALIQVSQVSILLSGCIATYSELEALLDILVPEDMTIFDRVKWARKESDVGKLIGRMQTHKASLSLMLTVLNGQSLSKVEQSVEELKDSIHMFYKDMSSRLILVDSRSTFYTNSLAAGSQSSIDGGESLRTIKGRLKPQPSSVDEEMTEEWFEFDRDLKGSRVYRKIDFHNPDSAMSIDDRHSTNWSHLSGLSLADVSHISVISLLITYKELHNPIYYPKPLLGDGTVGQYQVDGKVWIPWEAPWEDNPGPDHPHTTTDNASGFQAAGELLLVFDKLGNHAHKYMLSTAPKNYKTPAYQVCAKLLTVKQAYTKRMEGMLSEGYLLTMMNNPGGPQWKDKATHTRLRIVLGPNFELFLYLVSNLKKGATELERSLFPKHRRSKSEQGILSPDPSSEAILDELIHLLDTFRDSVAAMSSSRTLVDSTSRQLEDCNIMQQTATDVFNIFSVGQGYFRKRFYERAIQLFLPPSEGSTNAVSKNENETKHNLRLLVQYGRDSPPIAEYNQSLWVQLEVVPLQGIKAIESSLPQVRDLSELNDILWDVPYDWSTSGNRLAYIKDESSGRAYGIDMAQNLEENVRRSFYLPAKFSVPNTNLSWSSYISLSDPIPLETKFRAALTLCWTVLRLCHSPWLGTNWRKNINPFVYSVQSPERDIGLYLELKVDPETPQAGNEDLSLCSLSNSLPGPWQYDETLINLGILLIELALEKSIDQIAKSFDKYTGTGYSTALKVLRRGDITGIMGANYFCAIYYCFYFNLGASTADGEMDKRTFQLKVLEKIVSPLEVCLKSGK